ncbi:MAG: tyrosine-type recombinase/integrase [Gammaproteobacteria bacterium]|jgi:site-specific recombinase XerD|nr:tyrosine-type recombinase/integrase [Gammaproteobacteria bacterium]
MPSYQDDVILTRFEETLSHAALASSTIVNYLADLRAFLRWGRCELTPDFSLSQARQDHVRRYREYLAQELNRATSTVNRHLMALRKFFAFAVEFGVASDDPTAGVALLQTDGQTGSRILTEEEIDQLLTAAENGTRAGLVRRDQAILRLLLHAGLRVSELVNLTMDDLTFDYPGVSLEVSRNYNRTNRRRVPLQDKVCRALNNYLQVRPQTPNTNCFFLNQEGRPISKRTVQRIIADCAKAAGLVGVSAQSIRRTFARQLLLETQNLSLVSERLGHQNRNITEQYLANHKDDH